MTQLEKFVTVKSKGKRYYILVVKEDDDRYRWRGWNITGLKVTRNDQVLHVIDDKGDIFDYFSDSNYERGYPTEESAMKAALKSVKEQIK